MGTSCIKQVIKINRTIVVLIYYLITTNLPPNMKKIQCSYNTEPGSFGAPCHASSGVRTYVPAKRMHHWVLCKVDETYAIAELCFIKAIHTYIHHIHMCPVHKSTAFPSPSTSFWLGLPLPRQASSCSSFSPFGRARTLRFPCYFFLYHILSCI